ncbi:MAG: bifunctional 2-C-methyl-D-erythritol 4-phosphate cytidylyltransferase/2-C-methyl-D-erythritol 2,4-cyclodiphosphate synthase [Rhodospirillales bacterium]|jgi:2-C-methyl-D-erythritol 4-phosphate cytidylyltransferase / 2-C-methyl-D-erythritol 2,4-cyclodiphosphate synthase|nr:bifunctional 2-C-methyl-D-erythritol 4-phosphate cytidylyltransferase/2-C-methyl-D-erythritol 2,4-cyclodiphosphate synthase [Rhodospirillales bacterium]MBT4039548.1 bifunctional 2-C-methyl-D-erythritol 4-phosphate cytidylyltransferase/2-C-methyl-D-erythritol 2,4-cyclodiphosphate synthase [Rhodospirillales bacterium]MBT4625351.1 bifunctional 2-C-methyl-D-erythritol 4-phosphate cytidylyltransferase/2-C-methyl-D-erythritol 2,4-cyclodiphosphate synthase [Rhodospirillales bacterium]MBT5350941.1 bi
MDTNLSPQLPENPCIAVVVAAGRGMRAGGDVPKQYRAIGGVPLVRLTLESLIQHPGIHGVCAVIHPNDEALFEEATQGLALLPVVYGGATRQESVINGLRGIAALEPGQVLVHDGARPYPSPDLITRVLDGLSMAGGAVPALAVVDTLKRGNEDRIITATEPRDGLWRAQTPQGFNFAALLTAHEKFVGDEMTDDAAIAEAAGMRVILVDGEEQNIKVTTPEDFVRAERLANIYEPRSGMGYDVHRFCDGTSVQLCGVSIYHDRALEGHSDADVAMHALCDALYGAIGGGDIGLHFPPSDEQWRGASSEVFLSHAMERVRALGGRVANVDVTIICEDPKIGPHREAMRTRLAEITGMDIWRVNVKATTTERLGFTGRKEGIAAQAIATVMVPVSN